jgi:hypothetical protein
MRCCSGSLPAKEFIGKFLVDHGDVDARGVVLVGECAAAKNRNAVGLEVIGRDHVKARAGALRWIGKLGLAGDGERHAEAGAFKRQANRDGGVEHAGNSLDA